MSRSFILIHILQVDDSSQMINRSVIKEEDCSHISSLNLHQPCHFRVNSERRSFNSIFPLAILVYVDEVRTFVFILFINKTD